MQMLAHYQIGDYATFKTAFDADAEDRGNNSLSVLQIWREGAGAVWVLYEVSDIQKAKAYLEGAGQLFNRQAGVASAAFHQLELA